MRYHINSRDNIDGLAQDCSNSIANALELLQSCTKPSIFYLITVSHRCHCISNHQKIYCLFHSLLKLIPQKTSKHSWPFNRWLVDSSYKGPAMQKTFPCHEIIMQIKYISTCILAGWCELRLHVRIRHSERRLQSTRRFIFVLFCEDGTQRLVERQPRVSNTPCPSGPVYCLQVLQTSRNLW